MKGGSARRYYPKMRKSLQSLGRATIGAVLCTIISTGWLKFASSPGYFALYNLANGYTLQCCAPKPTPLIPRHPARVLTAITPQLLCASAFFNPGYVRLGAKERDADLRT